MKSDFSTWFSKWFSFFITSATQFSSSAHIFHGCRARIIKIQFSYVSKCCVFDIPTHTFSGRYKLMETTLLWFMFFGFLVCIMSTPFQRLCRRRSTGRAPCRKVLSNWMKSDFSTRFSKWFSFFITSTTQFSSSAHIFHVCRARIIKIQFSYVSKCCVFGISTHTFSGRYKLMETTLLCFMCFGWCSSYLAAWDHLLEWALCMGFANLWTKPSVSRSACGPNSFFLCWHSQACIFMCVFVVVGDLLRENLPSWCRMAWGQLLEGRIVHWTRKSVDQTLFSLLTFTGMYLHLCFCRGGWPALREPAFVVSDGMGSASAGEDCALDSAVCGPGLLKAQLQTQLGFKRLCQTCHKQKNAETVANHKSQKESDKENVMQR